MSNQSTPRIGLVWLPNSAPSVYVDGNFIEKAQSTYRPYLNLRYNPVRKVKYSISTTNQVKFFENASNETNINDMKGTWSNYFLGCYELKDSSTKLNVTNLIYDEKTSFYTNCEQICLTSYQQIFMLNNFMCTCMADK